MIIKVLFEGTCRFKDINEEIPTISQKVLTDRLKELEDHGIVSREVLDEKPVKVLYSLTKKGRELEQVMDAVQVWAVKWVK